MFTKDKNPKTVVISKVNKTQVSSNKNKAATDNVFCLAQVNIAEPVEPLHSATLKGFVDRLEEINTLAERSDGFVWRLKTDEGDATSIEIADHPELIVNLSQWRDIAALRSYVFETVHLELLQQRSDWFVHRADRTSVMWWMPRTARPTVEQSFDRLRELNERGPGPRAFTFAQPWPAPFELSADAIASRTPNLQPAGPGDLSAIQKLLDVCQLPSADLSDLWARGGWAYFLKSVDDNGDLVATGGLEICRDDGLLRSVVVREDRRGGALGRGVVDALEQLARERDIQKLYLLTETAADYFERRGYASVNRDTVPRAVGDSAQFSELCPASARCLVKQLSTI